MAEQLPAPFIPAGCDLRDFPRMPFEVARLRRSKAWLIAKKDPELGFYMINLWMAAWHEVPPGSLEDDDDVLCDFALCDERRWPKVRERVMRHWVKCSDGRLYHHVVAEMVTAAWESKVKQRARTKNATAARVARRANDEGPDEARDGDRDEARDVQRDVERHVHQEKGREGKGREGTGSVPTGTGGEPPDPPPSLAPAPIPAPPTPAKSQSPAEAEKSRLWAWVKTTLVEQKSCPDIKAAGVLAGKLAAKYGADVFADAARAAMATPPVDLHTYLVGLCETAAGKRVSLGRPGHMTDEQREAINAAETQKAKDLYRQRYSPASAGDFIDAETTVIEQPALEGPTA